MGKEVAVSNVYRMCVVEGWKCRYLPTRNSECRKSCIVVGSDSAELGRDEQEVGAQNGLRNPVRARRKPQHILERMVHTNVGPS